MDLLDKVKDQIIWKEADILDIPRLEEIFHDIDWVFHCAAKVSYRPTEKKEIYSVNVEGTANIVNMCLEFGIQKLLHVSSTAAIGRNKQNQLITERSKWNRNPFNTNYAISKYMAEQEVWRGMAEGLHVSVINPSMILGSGIWNQGTQRFFKLANKSFPFYPSGQNGFVDVRDVTSFAIKLMESNIAGERFILNSENLFLGKVLSTIALELGKKPPTIPVNRLIKSLSWRMDWVKSKLTGKPPFLTKETAQQASNKFLFDNKKSLEAFDFVYRPIEVTIRETCAQFLQSQQLKLSAMVLPLDQGVLHEASPDILNAEK